MFTKAIRELAKKHKMPEVTIAEAKEWAKLVASDDVANGEGRPEDREDLEGRLFIYRLRQISEKLVIFRD